MSSAASSVGGPLGALIAGGQSVRFGAPKWAAPFLGRPLAERALQALGPHAARVVVVAADPALDGLGVERWPDRAAGEGPLGALATALAGAQALALSGVFVLACDLPLVEAPLVGSILSEVPDAGDLPVVPEGPTGPEPLCAHYPLTILPHVLSALGRGERSLRRFLAATGYLAVSSADARAWSGFDDPFLNANTRIGLERAEATLGRRAAAVPTRG